MKYKKPKLFISVLAALLCIAVVAACVVNPTGTNTNNGNTDAPNTAAPTEIPATEAPATGAPATEVPATVAPEYRSVTFVNGLGENIDRLYWAGAGRVNEQLYRSELARLDPDNAEFYFTEPGEPNAVDIGANESVTIMEEIFGSEYGRTEVLDLDIACTVGGGVYVLYDAPVAAGESISLYEYEGNAIFSILSPDGAKREYAAEHFEGSLTAAIGRDERLLQLETAELRGYAVRDERSARGFRILYGDQEEALAVGPYIGQTELVLLRLTDEDAARFPQLAASLEAFNDELVGELNASFPFEELYAEYLENGSSPDYRHCCINVLPYIRRADDRVLSIVFDIWQGKRAVYHDRTETAGRRFAAVTFDSKTGGRLSLEDAAPGVTASAGRPDNEDFVWTYDHAGISFFANGDEPAVIAFVPIAEGTGIFNEDYLPETENYAVAVPYGTALFNTGANGESYSVRLSETAYTEEYSDGVTMERFVLRIAAEGVGAEQTVRTADGAAVSMPVLDHTNYSDHHLDSVLFVHANGSDYICVEKTGNNSDCADMFCLSAGRLFIINEGAAMRESFASFTDPGAFREKDHTYALGTSWCEYPAALNAAGMLLRTGWYTLREEHEVLLPIEARLVGADGAETGGTVTLEPGWKVVFIRTDGLLAEDMLLPDGRIARLTKEEPGSMYINGEALSDIFGDLGFYN